jgi:hypothetical protein
VGKIARGRSISQLSRSGLWLIGGMLFFSVAVLAWALQSDSATKPGHTIHRPAHARRSAVRIAAVRSQPAAMEVAARPPAVSDYETLLQSNTFQPRVVPRQSSGMGANSRAAQDAAEARRRRQAEKDRNTHPQPANTGDWRGWIYNGIAQINAQTYALMDQPNKKQSRFVKVGDRLEDATITQVSEKEVALREQEGSVVRVERVDAMAALLRSTRTPSVRGAPVTATTPALTAGPPGAGPAATPPSGQISPQPPAATAAVGDAVQRGQQGGRGRRFQQQDGGFGNPGG